MRKVKMYSIVPKGTTCVCNIVTHMGYKILHMESKGNAIHIWVEVDIDKSMVTVPLYLYAVGEEIDGDDYVGTVGILDGNVYFQVYTKGAGWK